MKFSYHRNVLHFVLVDEDDVEFPSVVPLLERFLVRFSLLIYDDVLHYVPKTVDNDRETNKKETIDFSIQVK